MCVPAAACRRSRPLARRSFPRNINTPQDLGDGRDHLLPLALKGSHELILDRLAEWPLITASDLGLMTGLSPSGLSQIIARLASLGLATRSRFGGRYRLGLTRRGLTCLARRDRTSAFDAIHRWAVAPEGGSPPASWREVPGIRSRVLARTIEHTDAVHRFLAQMSQQSREQGYQPPQFHPPHHSARHFPHRGQQRSIHPDASGMSCKGARTWPFFLEWERRAVRPGTMADRLAPYLRYYSSKRPLDDHGAWPLVLIVFDDYLAEGVFLGVARREMERSKVEVPLWVSYKERLEQVGPLGLAWRSPDALEPTCPFT